MKKNLEPKKVSSIFIHCIIALMIAGLFSFSTGCDEGSFEVDLTEEDVLTEPESLTVFSWPSFDGFYPGYVTTSASSSYANRCAREPETDISSEISTDPGYIMAYRSGKSSCSVWAPTNEQNELIHRQGIQRFRRNGYNYLLVSGSVNSEYYAGFEVVKMASRGNDLNGLGSGGVTPTSWPLCSDAIVEYATYPYSSRRHAGGLQVNGRFVALPLEDEDDSYTAAFRIYDLADPENPVQGSTVFRQRGSSSEKKNAGAAAFTRLNNGKYMVMIFGNDSDEVEVFVTSGTTISTSASIWESKHQEDTPSGFEKYQNVQFITACSDKPDKPYNGRLYVLGTHNQSGSKDWADLWRVTFSTDGNYNPSFSKVANRNMTCRSSNTGNTRYCNFHAGAGAYVNYYGDVYIYGVEHYDDAYPNTGYGVKVREFTSPTNH